jgi:hypothetical protein
MSKIALVLAFLLLAVGAAPSQSLAQQVSSIEIVDFGIYTADPQARRLGQSGIGTTTVANIKLAVSTDRIPIQQGIRFGFQYRIDGAPADARVELRRVDLYPAPGITPPGKSQPVRQDEERFVERIGNLTFAGYTLDAPYEMLPGTWTFQLWVGDRKLAEKSFTLVTP